MDTHTVQQVLAKMPKNTLQEVPIAAVDRQLNAFLQGEVQVQSEPTAEEAAQIAALEESNRKLENAIEVLSGTV